MILVNNAELLQSCLTLCNPMDCSPPSSSVHGIFQARVLQWVDFLQGIFLTQRLNLGNLHCRRILYRLSHQGSKSARLVVIHTGTQALKRRALKLFS